ncbi:MAG: Holliday junction resolvase [Thermoplasmata archaeon HGW-Thermoplasmata-1]|nr:MAG: Holliday junction resolvase [Thermoplasmata archaeon HGW-Thermoplasmata-1]
MGSNYEREFKGILSGDREIIERITKTCDTVEKMNYARAAERPFIVVRAAGSLGTADMVALRDDASFIVEVKSSSFDVIRFTEQSGRLQEQALFMKNECERAGVLPIYAYRLKGVRGDFWRIFTLDMRMPEGRSRILHSRIPRIETTKSGNYVMRWENGMKLSDFFGYICR